MLVVFGIIGLILALSIPAMTDYSRNVRLQGAVRQVAGLVSLARTTAISRHERRTVLIDFARGELLIEETLEQEEPRRVVLPRSVEIEVESQAEEPEGEGQEAYRLIFQPTGSLSGRSATLLLSSDDRTQIITILAATGAILIE